MRKRQPWDHQSGAKSYEYAVLEIDATKLPQRIQTAESAISARLAELNNSIDLQEPKALRDALRVLKLMAKHKPWLKGAA